MSRFRPPPQDDRPLCVEHIYVAVVRGRFPRRVYIECQECSYSFLIGYVQKKE